MVTDQRANVVPLKPASAAQATNGGVFQGVVVEKPPRPAWLSERALEHWDYITEELFRTGQISRLDKGTLEILCISYAGMQEAEETIQREQGEYQKYQNGVTQLSAAAVAFQRHSARYFKLAQQFGLTVRARKQMDLRDPNQGELEL